MHQKIFFTYFLKSKNVPKRKKEVDNPRHFDQVWYRSVNVKIASLIGPELQCLISLLHSP